jgi:hypothetical protein
MSWYLKLNGKEDVVPFTKYLTNHAGHEWKKIMPQLLRIRQVQLKNDQIPGTWQSKTPEGKIAELLCTYGHGRTLTVHNPDGTTSEMEVSQFVKDIHNVLGRWLPSVIEQTVIETEKDPATPSSPRDPKYYAIAATKLANNKNVRALGPITKNATIDLILNLMGSVGDKYDPELEELYVQFRRYATQQAARQYEEAAANQDKAKLDTTAVKALKKIRDHQKMKLDGSGVKGAHAAGNFWLLGRAIDGMPILLVSSKEEKEISESYISQATNLASASNATVCTGSFAQDKKANQISFTVERGQTQTPVFVSALTAMGVRRGTVVSAPGALAWR